MERLQSGTLSPESKSHIYLIIHRRVGTRDRGHRLMPGRFPSPLCHKCEPISHPETIQHRYIQCKSVYQTWEWLRNLLLPLDPLLTFCTDENILFLDFPKSIRETAIIWLIGTYIEMVEREVVLKNHILNQVSAIGYFKQKKQKDRYMAMPEVGLIPFIDWDAQGVG